MQKVVTIISSVTPELKPNVGCKLRY